MLEASRTAAADEAAGLVTTSATAAADEEAASAQKAVAAVRDQLTRHQLVWKFCMYGFFKNLQLFESFLWAVLLSWGYSLFEIGILNAIIEGITYLLEVPSGIVADNFGKKRQLMLCFVLYICSFVAYSNGRSSFGVLALASVLYGLGEAFRSGTHKGCLHAFCSCVSLLMLLQSSAFRWAIIRVCVQR